METRNQKISNIELIKAEKQAPIIAYRDMAIEKEEAAVSETNPTVKFKLLNEALENYQKALDEYKNVVAYCPADTEIYLHIPMINCYEEIMNLVSDQETKLKYAKEIQNKIKNEMDITINLTKDADYNHVVDIFDLFDIYNSYSNACRVSNSLEIINLLKNVVENALFPKMRQDERAKDKDFFQEYENEYHKIMESSQFIDFETLRLSDNEIPKDEFLTEDEMDFEEYSQNPSKQEVTGIVIPVVPALEARDVQLNTPVQNNASLSNNHNLTYDAATEEELRQWLQAKSSQTNARTQPMNIYGDLYRTPSEKDIEIRDLSTTPRRNPNKNS